MAGVIDRLKLRRCYPVPIGSETVHCRAMTIGELRALDKLPEELQTAFAFGCSLTDEKGAQEFPLLLVEQVSGQGATVSERLETHEEYAKRVLLAMDDFGADTLREVSLAIGRLTGVPAHGDLVKN